MEFTSLAIRRTALRKIAALSVSSPEADAGRSDLERLSRSCRSSKPWPNGSGGSRSQRPAPTSHERMSPKELESILALCQAAPRVAVLEDAQRLLSLLSPYLLGAHSQSMIPSPFLRSIEPSPWEAMTYALSSAVLQIGLSHAPLRELVHETIISFLEECQRTATAINPPRNSDGPVDLIGDSEEALSIATITVSILGFLDAAATHAAFWTLPQRLQVTELVRAILSEDFRVSIEAAFSTIRHSHASSRSLRDWRRYLRHYASVERPLGAILLQRGVMRFLVSSTSLLVADAEVLRQSDVLDVLMASKGSPTTNGFPGFSEGVISSMEAFSEILMEEMGLLEDGADFLRLGSPWQQRLAFDVKACIMIAYLNCTIVDDDIAEPETLMAWLEETMAEPTQMADETLASTTVRSMAVLATTSAAFASSASRLLPRFIVQGPSRRLTVGVAANCLAFVLKLLSQDAVITTLYTLGNVLSSGNRGERGLQPGTTPNGSLTARQAAAHLYNGQETGSAISLTISGEEETSATSSNVLQAIVGIAKCCDDEKITALAQSMLIQKFGKISTTVDARIVRETAILAVIGGPLELRSALRFYSKLSHESVLRDNLVLLDAIRSARNHLSTTLTKDSQPYEIYLTHLLETIISKGDVHEGENTHEADVELAAREIAELLQPLAVLLSCSSTTDSQPLSDEVIALCRDAWFNIVVHGFSASSELGKKYVAELRLIAAHSHPLISEQRAMQLESDIELNTILRRGMSAQHATEQRRILAMYLPSRESDIRGLSYPKLIFLRAAYLLESLRAECGDYTKVLVYFLDSSLGSGEMGSCMEAICDGIMNIYVKKALNGFDQEITAPKAAEQLAGFFVGSCHRNERVQIIAASCAERMIAETPSVLCQRSSLFALLELLSLMWTACLESETDEYDWKSSFTSLRAKVSVEVSDDYVSRRRTLNALHKRARGWMMRVINVAPLDIKGLLQTYLSEYDDDGAYGHVSLGRSFALEMGAAVPTTDQRLGAIDRHGDFSINTASDFIAQYTTRQQYRLVDALQESESVSTSIIQLRDENRTAMNPEREEAEAILAQLNSQTLSSPLAAQEEIRDALRRAAALLCRSKGDQCAIVHHLVNIPFAAFTKQSIKLGVSLWMGVINENPRMEPRIMAEVAQNWEATVREKLGIFNRKSSHRDPFYIKQEFAPSDREALVKRQQAVLNIIGPHFRVLHFLASHFNAMRLGSTHSETIFIRLIRITLDGLQYATGHPLSREIHFQIILLGLKILRHSTSLDGTAKWFLKDQILSGALSWFKHFPKWSFGGNRVQTKAETHLLADVEAALRNVAHIGYNASGYLKSLQPKQDLVFLLLNHEQTRLIVWLFPLDHDQRHHFASGSTARSQNDVTLSAASKAAWREGPELAIQLVNRFHSPRLANEVRWMLLNFPERAISEPDALQTMLGSSLPTDISSQLKYLLYWAPVNPITAVTYFLPAYGNHPYILQYAMRALESHSVDITFFYVPQIVQTLRYDVLGYVERYIIETAKISQLFAHQIIWNMKANAYKDEESQIPDLVKPVLDKVMGALIESFSRADRAFYEREFSFFNDITDISGKLRPFIKKTKPEKKQKIEEELRKIKVEVGVYLPSNPDGVVIGIDRKSGKPLQSHAKAPYMATFRIRKTILEADTSGNPEKENMGDIPSRETSVEVWQSAIFKVGDDCRQDVLALQMIAAFRGIFNNVGLDVYVYPYRVTATAPGCGVIDVLPNSISRDMLGREAVNGLYDYFVSKYGGEGSIRFQEARTNFVKSMASYSVISYLLQFKDRHNGNIMVDDAGHILHIDFGFCFDIAPGGVRFERAPFKLTSEMVAVMGGSTASQSYHWFEELCIKSFLASRPHVEKLVHLVVLMLDSGLPCFKPETIQHFRERFVLEKTEREAADFMRDLVKKSYSSYSTKGYDQFQLMTNGIPY